MSRAHGFESRGLGSSSVGLIVSRYALTRLIHAMVKASLYHGVQV